MNSHFSKDLLKIKEPALDAWAKDEGAEEAYRLTILPTFSKAEMLRIFRKDKLASLVYILGRRRFFNDSGVNDTLETKIDKAHWEELTEFMEKYFWTADKWDEEPTIDGTILFFEGWKDEKYKCFSVCGIPEINPHQAYLLFEKIKTQAISHLGNSDAIFRVPSSYRHLFS